MAKVYHHFMHNSIQNATQKDNLKPSLLDRLTDDAFRRHKESKSASIMSIKQYRKSMLRDIMFLLNTNDLFNSQYEAVQDIPDNVLSSTLNYGTPALSGMIVTNIDWIQLENDIKQSLIRFEDRLEKDSIKVVIHVNNSALLNESELFIEIFGNLTLTQYEKEFWLKTKVDIGTGLFSLVEG